eukprot:3828-Heterococcus_DN1.PRE.1
MAALREMLLTVTGDADTYILVEQLLCNISLATTLDVMPSSMLVAEYTVSQRDATVHVTLLTYHPSRCKRAL